MERFIIISGISLMIIGTVIIAVLALAGEY